MKESKVLSSNVKTEAKKIEGNVEEEPPFPHLAIGFLCIGMLAHSIVFTSPLPYVAFMIVDFHMTDDLDVAGYTAGWVTGMFMVGRAIAGIPWGLAADRFGRRACIFLSIFNITVLGLLFGFSVNFYMAVGVRFLIGLGNGFMGVAKTYVSEIVKCKNHELRAFGYLNGIFGLGMIVGPAIGGTLARPAVQYPTIFDQNSLFAHFPYLLPSLACAFIAAVALIGIFFFVPETLPMQPSHNPDQASSSHSSTTKRLPRPYLTVNQSEELDDQSMHNTIEMVSVHGELDPTENDEEKRVESYLALQVLSQKKEMEEIQERGSFTKNPLPSFTIEESEEEDEGFEESDIEAPQDSKPHHQSASSSNQKQRNHSQSITTKRALPATLTEIFQDRRVQSIFLNYMLYCFICMFFDESFPLYAVSSIANGGLAWESVEVGETLASVGLGMVLFQLLFFERCMRACFKGSTGDSLARTESFVSYVMPLLPLAANGVLRLALAQDSSVNTRTYLPLRAIVVLVLFLKSVPSMASFTSITMLVNASVDAKMRGTVNGLMMTAGMRYILDNTGLCLILYIGSIGNGAGPILGSACYAAALQLVYGSRRNTDHHEAYLLPIDGRLVFILAGLMCFALSWFTRYKLDKEEEE